MKYTAKSKIRDVISDPAFGDFGRLLFPVQRNYMQGASLGTMNLSWYANICPEDTVAVVNDLWERASAGETVFYDVYSEAEKTADPAKRDTGLFCFRESPAGRLPFFARAAVSVTSARCTTVFPMRWRFPGRVFMHSP